MLHTTKSISLTAIDYATFGGRGGGGGGTKKAYYDDSKIEDKGSFE